MQKASISSEQFDHFIQHPDHVDQRWELINGEIIEVVSENYSSELAITIAAFIKRHLREQGIHVRVTGADGGYIIGGNHFIPDVAYISAEKQPEPSREAYNPNHPDLVVEVISPNDKLCDVAVKTNAYQAAGILAWVLYPDE